MASLVCRGPLDQRGRPALRAWLRKRRQAGRMVGGFDRRYFTLDFDDQQLFYQHSETEKTISKPIKLSSIDAIWAITQGNEFADGTNSSPLVASPSPRGILSLNCRAVVDHYGFVLQRGTWRMEVLCANKEEADKWLRALREVRTIVRAQLSYDRDLPALLGNRFEKSEVGVGSPLDKSEDNNGNPFDKSEDGYGNPFDSEDDAGNPFDDDLEDVAGNPFDDDLEDGAGNPFAEEMEVKSAQNQITKRKRDRVQQFCEELSRAVK